MTKQLWSVHQNCLYRLSISSTVVNLGMRSSCIFAPTFFTQLSKTSQMSFSKVCFGKLHFPGYYFRRKMSLPSVHFEEQPSRHRPASGDNIIYNKNGTPLSLLVEAWHWEGREFKPSGRLSWVRSSLLFLGCTRQMLGWYQGDVRVLYKCFPMLFQRKMSSELY